MAKRKYTSFSGLLNQGVSDFEKPVYELSAMKNCYEYKIGKLQKVPGYSVVGDQILDEADVSFLHYYYDSSSNTNYLIAGTGSGSNYRLKYRTTGNWNTYSMVSSSASPSVSPSVSLSPSPSATPSPTDIINADLCAVNFLDKAFIVGYDTETSNFIANTTIDGTVYSSTDSDLTSMPQGKYIIRYRDLLYVLNAYTGATKYPNRAYYCDEPSAGAITWSPTTKFLEFGYDDGDEITGGVEALDRLLVFKHFSMWKYDESSRVKIDDVGCDSYKSIINMGGIPYWFNRMGFYRWGGAKPQLISAKAQQFIDSIDQTKLDEVVAVRYGFEYRAYIGDITIDDVTYNNAWFCFDTKREKIYIRCTYDEVKSACQYVESGKQRAYFGTNDGYVMKFATPVDKIYSDNGSEIDSFFVTNYLDHGDPSVIKHSNHLTVYTKYCQGMKLAVDVDKNNDFNEDRARLLNNNVEEIDIDSSGYRFAYKFYEKSSAKSWEFEGFISSNELKEDLS